MYKIKVDGKIATVTIEEMTPSERFKVLGEVEHELGYANILGSRWVSPKTVLKIKLK